MIRSYIYFLIILANPWIVIASDNIKTDDLTGYYKSEGSFQEGALALRKINDEQIYFYIDITTIHNGHNCGMEGLAILNTPFYEHKSINNPISSEICILRIYPRKTDDKIHIEIEDFGLNCRSKYCGANGELNSFFIKNPGWFPVE